MGFMGLMAHHRCGGRILTRTPCSLGPGVFFLLFSARTARSTLDGQLGFVGVIRNHNQQESERR